MESEEYPMWSKCDSCTGIIKKMKTRIEFANKENEKDVMVAILESIGDESQCGLFKNVCIPLMKVMGTYRRKDANS